MPSGNNNKIKNVHANILPMRKNTYSTSNNNNLKVNMLNMDCAFLFQYYLQQQ
jgi:uncharacterized pyridoxamine 5'-phosphate oxidase family protein